MDTDPLLLLVRQHCNCTFVRVKREKPKIKMELLPERGK